VSFISSNKNILISGAGIAGTTLAFWLKKFGFNPTIVEHAPKLREGGQYRV
jgi:2-polyprenyl-6-methoxyphenol hydroxylase-like FAD-dependent oxidoreductase